MTPLTAQQHLNISYTPDAISNAALSVDGKVINLEINSGHGHNREEREEA